MAVDLDRPIRRLLPDRERTTIGAQLGGLDLVARAGPDRPYVVTNFALTLDGHATIGGRSGAIGSDADTSMLVGLRTRVDAVMIGAGTMRAERYGRIIGDPAKRELRERDGLAPDPLVVIVSGRLDLPWDAPLFTDPDGPVVICTAAAADPPPTKAEIHLVRHPEGVDLGSAPAAAPRRPRRPGAALRGRSAAAWRAHRGRPRRRALRHARAEARRRRRSGPDRGPAGVRARPRARLAAGRGVDRRALRPLPDGQGG